jgi:phospholipase/carboxylesterase
VPETLEEKHFLVMHGTQDDLIPVKGGRAVRDYLQSTPASIAYHEYPVGHTIHPDALEVIREWLASQLEQANEQGA